MMKYIIMECTPLDEFDWVSSVPVFESDDMDTALAKAYDIWEANQDKAFMVYQPEFRFCHGSYGMVV